MRLETKTDLNDTTIEKLQKLIRANIDSYNGFHESAEELSDAALANLFREIGDQRSAMASELQNFVEFNGEEAEEDGSVAAKVHRIWINIRGKINGGDPHVILIEAERGEDHIKEAYEDVLTETAGSAMNDVLTKQYAAVKAGHDKIRDLRDACKSK
ncbi:MAG: PA2169 family four-helix-bundle protein [Planctomycetales bacterium]|nr:PA2169 family four-helix-bundle protein [Planctomycetales bacterium]